jgi:hypothetical protein
MLAAAVQSSATTRRLGPSPPRRESGAVLMIMLLILVLGAAALFASNLADRSRSAARVRESAEVLARAKEALLGYAAAYDATSPGNFGFLPCPDINTTGSFAEGEAHATACQARYRSVIGRFPWKTLGLNPARGEIGECLWYAVSGSWKAAGANSPEMLNPDTAGQFRVVAGDGTTVLAGAAASERAVAVIIAPGSPRAGQARNTLASGVAQCAGNYTARNYLDADAGSGIDNATLAAAADSIDEFVSGDAARDDLNDQVIFVTRAEIEERLMRRADLQAQLANLTQAAAKCVADYGKRNPGGAANQRLPWPAPVDLAQYRSDSQYDDTPIGDLSGRLPDRVNDSNSRTGNTIARLLTNCSAATVPEWTPEMLTLWRHWKDHLFYAVAGSFRPDAAPHSTCGTCLTVNGAGAWAAVVMFSGARLAALGQVRDEPPLDADTRNDVASYLEGRNAANHPNAAGNADYQSGGASATFNDVLYCVDASLGVAPC